MLGLINQVPEHESQPSKTGRLDPVKVAIYDRSSKSKQLEIAGHEAFVKADTPQGFSWEDSVLGHQGGFPVYVHHKFVVVDS